MFRIVAAERAAKSFDIGTPIAFSRAAIDALACLGSYAPGYDALGAPFQDTPKVLVVPGRAIVA